MTAMLRPFWLLHIALAFAAMVGAVRADGSSGERIASAGWNVNAITALGAGSARAVTQNVPVDRASTRLASTTRAAWQRGNRRPPRTSSTPLVGVERAPGAAFGPTAVRRIGAPHTSVVDRFRRDGRLRAAPTRAPPIVG